MTHVFKQIAMAGLTAAACLGAAGQTRYSDMCDASAAVGLPGGHFVVADDESDVLRIYRRGVPAPVGRVDLADQLGNRDKKGKTTEADLEGAAQIGDRIYWISSHARKGDASEDRHRHRFFATRILATSPVPSVEAVGTVQRSLLDLMLEDPRFGPLVAAAGLGPEADGGLNIEGLAATEQGTLLIGFRNPKPGGKALVVPLLNPAPVIDDGATPEFGPPRMLDLGGRGIRSMERVGDAFVIAAGPHATATTRSVQPAFALYRWSGHDDQAPVLVRSLDAGTERAEALFVDALANELLILSDDGDEQVAGRDCKKKKVPAARKSFRSRALPLPLKSG